MKLFKKIFKNKVFIGATIISIASFIVATSFIKNDIVINNKILNSKSTRDVVVAKPNVYQEIVDIASIGADVNDFGEFKLAHSIQPTSSDGGAIQLIKISDNKNIDWGLNTPSSGGNSAYASRIELSAKAVNQNKVIIIPSLWTNTPEFSSNINEQKNSFFVRSVNARPIVSENGEYDYSDIANSETNNGFSYSKGTLPAPPYPNDDEEQLQQSKYKYYQLQFINNFPSEFQMDFSPLLINFGAKTNRIVEETGQVSKYNYYPYIKSSIPNTNQYNVLSANENGEANPDAINRGMFFDPENSFSSFSGIFDAIPNTVDAKEYNKQFGQYFINLNEKTTVSNFEVKFNSDNKKLPSEKVKEILNDKNFFNYNNFGISATNAIPSTFYGSKLKMTADDNQGTIKFDFFPGIGATSYNTSYGAKVYDLVKPITSNVSTITIAGWKTIDNTTVKNSYTLISDDFLYQNAQYAQIAATDPKYLNKLKELIKEKIIFGNVPPSFDLNDIRIDQLEYLNKEGKITFNLYLKDIYVDKNVLTSEKSFGQITIDGFETINAITEIVKSEITIDGLNVLLSDWLKNPNLNEELLSLIKANNSIINLPKNANLIIDPSIVRENHPPKAIVTVGADKLFKFNESKNDFYIEFVENSNQPNATDYLPLGNISFVGFEEIWQTEIIIDPSKLDNNKKNYPSQYSIENAIDLIYESVVHAPTGFDKKNIIITDFSKDNLGGSVFFNVQLNSFYDANLNLVNNVDKFVPIRVNIKNFKQALGPTSFTKNYSSVEWSQLTVFEFSDENINTVIREKCFINLLPESNITYTEITRNSIEGQIVVSGSVDKYFDENSDYKDVSLGDSPLLFTITLVNFFKTSETTLNVNTLNVSLPNHSPLDIQSKTLKNKLLPLINSKPKGFTIDNILFQDAEGNPVYNPDNTKGNVVVNLGINLWYNQEGLLQTSFKDFGEFTFTGLKITRETIIPSTGWENAGAGFIASEVAKNRIELIAILNSHIEGDKPDSWNPVDDIIICDSNGNPINDVSYDNKQGTIDLYVKLKRFYDANGVLQTQWNKEPVHIVIGGFQQLFSTSVLTEFTVPNVSNKLPTEYSLIDIKELINKHKTDIFKHPAPNFDVNNDMSIEFDQKTPNPNNLNGTISINYSITNYYDSDGLHETNPNRPLEGNLLLKGFKHISETTINTSVAIQGYNNIVASTLTKANLLELVENKSSLFFNNAPEDGVRIINVNISNNELNLEGKLKIQITYSNYYDKSGNLITNPTTSPEITLSGFKIVKKTTFNNSITLPTKSQYFPSDLTPSILSNILSEPTVLPLLLNDYPENFSSRDILEIKIVERQNLYGSVKINLKIINYYDDKGNIQLVDPLFIRNIVIDNFSSNKATEFLNELSLPPSSPLTKKIASDISNQELQDFVYENINKIAIGLPTNFNKANLRSATVVKHDNLLGIVKAEIGINNFYDKDGVLQTTTIYKWQITITGFRTVVATEINTSIALNDVSTIKPSEVDNIELISIMMRNKKDIFNNLPDNFSEQNIIVKSLVPNDSNGTLIADISITLYYDDKGNVQNANNPKNVTITFSNFATIETTKIVETFALSNVGEIIASQFPINKLKELVFFNLGGIIPSLPENFNYYDIKDVEFLSADNKVGSLSARIIITNFFNSENGLVDNVNTLSGDVLFTGFKKISPTTAIERFRIDVSEGVTADEFNNDEIKSYITKYYEELFSPLPNNFTDKNIIKVNIISINNLSGEINVSVMLDSYFDENSNYSNIPKEFRLTLFGFEPVKETKFIENVHLNTINNISPYSLSANEIIDLIYSNRDSFIKNPGPNFTISNINLSSIDNIDNSNGVLEVSISYSNYYDSTGTLILDKSITKKHFISGFLKNSKITRIRNSNFFINDYGHVLAQEIVLTSAIISQIIYENINFILYDVPQDLRFDEISINDIRYNNLEGEISLKLFLYKYYDDNSILVNDSNKKKEFNLVLSGFKKVQPTSQILNEVYVPFSDDILASSLLDISTIKNFVWGKKDEIFSWLPSKISLKDINIEISSSDNINGTITLNIRLFKWYSNSGELQSVSSNSYKLVLTGFKKIKETIVNRNVDISFPENAPSSYYYAETVTSEDIRNIISYNKNLFFNYIPNDFNYLNIQSVQILSRDNVNGKIKIKFSYFNYYDSTGKIEKIISKTTDVITINGFFKIAPTNIINKVSVAKECFNNLASEYRTSLFNNLNNIIASKKYEIFDGTIPNDANVSLTSINSINNLDGTANVTISIDKYYNEKGVLVNDVKNFNLTLFGFKTISTASTIANQNISSSNTNFSINIDQFNSIYRDYFLGVIPSNVSTSPNSFINIFELALNSNEILVQNGLKNSNYELIKILNIKYKPNSANDIDGSLVLTADVINYWDSINGEFNSTPLPITITLSGFKSTLSSQVSPMKIVVLVIVILAALTICLLIALFIAKSPKIFKRKI